MPASPSISFQPQIKEQTIKNRSSVTPLVAALNDPARTRIGNPWRGTYHLSIAANDWEADILLSVMQELAIDVQVNLSRWNTAQSERYLAIYDVDSLRSVLATVGEQLKDSVQVALDSLVRARGPIPEYITRATRQKHDVHGLSFEQIAHLMNDKRIVDGMGGRGWTARKVRDAYRGVGSRKPAAPTQSSHAKAVGAAKAQA
jgi:hypothetical protein